MYLTPILRDLLISLLAFVCKKRNVRLDLSQHFAIKIWQWDFLVLADGRVSRYQSILKIIIIFFFLSISFEANNQKISIFIIPRYTQIKIPSGLKPDILLTHPVYKYVHECRYYVIFKSSESQWHHSLIRTVKIITRSSSKLVHTDLAWVSCHVPIQSCHCLSCTHGIISTYVRAAVHTD